MRHLRWVLLLGAACLMLIPARHARADAAPPAVPPAASVEGAEITQVRMESEEVLLVVEALDPQLDPNEPGYNFYSGLAATWMAGRVEATFQMRNLGAAEESFDVRFPLGAPDGYSEVAELHDFAAWVNDIPAPIAVEETPDTEFDEYMVPWATWPVTFPPGQPVTLRVTYDVQAGGYMPYGEFLYILETGAGWQGPIGEGTITIRLPYEVNETNAVFQASEGYGWMLPNPVTYEVSGRDVTWHFTDLEPTAEDNIRLRVLAPQRWLALDAAQQQVAANPDSAEAQLALARACRDGLSIKYGVDPIGNSQELVQCTQDAYRQSLELAPDDVDVYVEYLDLLTYVWAPYEPSVPPGDLLPLLERALELDPDNERLLQIQDQVAMFAVTPTPGPEPTPEPLPASTPTPMPPLGASATPLPPPATPTPAPASGGGLCPGTLGIAVLPLAGIGLRRARRSLLSGAAETHRAG